MHKFHATMRPAFLTAKTALPSPQNLAGVGQHFSYHSFTPKQTRQALQTAAQFVQAYWSNDPFAALQEWDTYAIVRSDPSQTLSTYAVGNWFWRYTNPYSGILPTRSEVLHNWVTYSSPLTLTEIQSGHSAALFPMSGPHEQIAPVVLIVHPTIHVVQTLWRNHTFNLVQWSQTLTVQVAWIQNIPSPLQWQIVALNNHFSHPVRLQTLLVLSSQQSP
jgi:hypothetical protein